MSRKKCMLFIGDSSENYDLKFYKWLVSMLSKEFIIKELYIQSIPGEKKFFLVKYVSFIKEWEALLRNYKPEKVLTCGDLLTTTWLIFFIVRFFKLKIELILFRYDINHFRPCPKGLIKKMGHLISLKLEKYCMLRADKIIHMGLDTELAFLPFYNKIKNKPQFLFREFINKKTIKECNMKNKLSYKDKEIHLVFVGNFCIKDFPFAESMWKFIPKITSQKMHLHQYSNLNGEVLKKMLSIEQKDSYFHYEGYVPHDKLIKEISKYDYGLFMPLSNLSGAKQNIYVMTSIGNKIFDYISAHLPFITSKDATAAINLINDFKIGLYLDYNKIENLKDLLIKQEYNQIIKNIKKALPNFSDKKSLIKFLILSK